MRTVHTGSVSLDHSLPGCNTAVVCASVAPWRDDPSARSVCSCLSTETRYNTILFIERHTKNTTFWSYNGLWSIFFFQNIPFRIQYNSSSFLSFFLFYYLKPVMKELKCSNQTPAIHSTFINVRHQHVCQINILRYFRSKSLWQYPFKHYTINLRNTTCNILTFVVSLIKKKKKSKNP